MELIILKIREADIGDVEGISVVHVNSWRTTYKGLLPDTYLSQLSVKNKVINWNWTFKNLKRDEVTFVAINHEEQIVGFCNSGKNRDTDFEYDGEIYAIYLLEEYQGCGIGKQLIKTLIDTFTLKGYSSIIVWVLEGNPSEEFYKKLGGQLIGQKNIKIGEDTHVELAYSWKSLDTFNESTLEEEGGII